ncbi:TPA: MBL fold metallo-hydrolase [Vibrio cholerae]|nr:MBL fold metallo-hydrolase [Vibrio cholerae]HDZ9391730.1 MBL fold metallo-hydrolase [Vibrio cholerae]
MSETAIQTKTQARQRKVFAHHHVQHYRSQLERRISHSPQFREGKVINAMPHITATPSWWQTAWSYFGGRAQLKPNARLPVAPLNLQALQTRSQALRVTWLGHSSLFIEVDGLRVLTDPVFDYASPWIAKAWFARNLPNSGVREQLPLPDVIVISHDHYDHLEQASVVYYAAHSVTFYVPLGVGQHLIRWGVSPERIIEFDWWEQIKREGVEFICTPANHNSGRYYLDHNATLWCSWVIKGHQETLYFSGDSAYDTHFVKIAERCGPIDLACLEVAADVKQHQGYPVENWGHMQAKHTVQAFRDLQAKKLLPIHWATYELFTHQWDEPIADLVKHCQEQSITLLTPMAGESLTMANHSESHAWWQGLETEPTSGARYWQMGLACSLLLLLMVV